MLSLFLLCNSPGVMVHVEEGLAGHIDVKLVWEENIVLVARLGCSSGYVASSATLLYLFC